MALELFSEGLVLIVSLALLAKSASLAVRYASRLARMSGLGELSIGFVLVSAVTSLPELSIGITSALSSNIGLTIGNVMGANVANVLLIAGVCAFFYPGAVRPSVFGKLSIILFLTALIPLILFQMGSASRLGGIALLLSFLAFSFYSIKKPGMLKKLGFVVTENSIDGLRTKAKKLMQSMVWLGVGIAGVVVSSQFVVGSAVVLAGFLNIAKSVLGATIISLGTTLPELSVSLTAYLKGKRELALGNMVGSAMTNLTLILGTALSLSAFSVNFNVFSELILFTVLASIFLALLIENGRLGRGQGAALLVAYGLFLVFTMLAGRAGQ